MFIYLPSHIHSFFLITRVALNMTTFSMPIIDKA